VGLGEMYVMLHISMQTNSQTNFLLSKTGVRVSLHSHPQSATHSLPKLIYPRGKKFQIHPSRSRVRATKQIK